MDYNEYKLSYEQHGIAPGDSFRRKNKYTEAQLKTRFKKYLLKHPSKGKTEQELLRERAIKRDNNECQFCKLLGIKKSTILDYQNRMIGASGVDMCHVFEKGSYPRMAKDLDNVVMLKRIVHNRLDEGLDPITGEKTDKEIIEGYWELILGADRYYDLERKAGKQ